MNRREIQSYHDLRDIILKNRLTDRAYRLGKMTVLHDVIYIEGTEEEYKNAIAFLKDSLGRKLIKEDTKYYIKLDTKKLDVFFEKAEDDVSLDRYPFRPLLEDIALLDEDSRKDRLLTQFNRGIKDRNVPYLHAFFSYKGGVGRTMHILAAARYFAEQTKSAFAAPQILLIDADTEAPGLTWWAQEKIPAPQYSYLDLLADTVDAKNPYDILEYAANKIKLMRLELGNAQHSVFFLPVFRDAEQMMRPPANPEQLTHKPESPWLAGDILLHLGKKLNVKHIFVDLRAGMSELASPLFFDPQVHRLLFTTTSRQSIEGTCCVLQQLAKMASLLKQYDNNDIYLNNTSVIMNFIPPDEINSIKLNEVSTRLMKSRQSLLSKDDDIESDSWMFQASYDQNLLGLDTLEQALSVLERSTAIQDICQRLWKDVSPQKKIPRLTDEVRRQDIQKLHDKTKRLIFAEQSDFNQQTDWKKRFLQIEPYRQLASNFSTTVPNAIIIGAKGAGKTYLYLQLSAMRRWDVFCDTLSIKIDNNIELIPLSWSESNNATQDLTRLSEESLNTAFSTSLEKSSHHMLRESFVDVASLDEASWRKKWYQYILLILNTSFSDNTDLRQLLKQTLAGQTKKITFLMDGLEDLFAGWLAQDIPITPLRILLVELISDIYEWSNGNIGFLIFIRKDIIRRAILQNSAQFIAKYRSYELDWSKNEALRLVGWILIASDLKKYCKTNSMQSWYAASFDSMSTALEPFWGLKLGTPNSKEAYSVNWVLSALSDFKGHIQARDIVRFLYEVSNIAVNEDKAFFKDRLIMPKMLKDALDPCGKEKIQEIKQEMQEIAQSIDKLKGSKKSIPFEKKDFEELQIQNIAALEEFGFIFNEDGEYYFPEMYRRGLSLGISKGARPKVVSLMRKALASR